MKPPQKPKAPKPGISPGIQQSSGSGVGGKAVRGSSRGQRTKDLKPSPKAPKAASKAPKKPEAPIPGRAAKTQSKEQASNAVAKRPQGIAASGPLPAATVLGRKTPSLGSLEQARHEKKKAGRRLIFRRIAIVLGVLAAIAFLAWLALFSSLFALQKDRVEVSGPQGLDLSVAVKASDAELGKSLFLVSEDQIREVILKDTRIQNASVTKVWPDGLKISLSARTAVAAVHRGEIFDLVGVDGVVISSGPDAPAGLVRIEADADLDAEKLAGIQTILGALPQDLRSDVAQVVLLGGVHKLHFGSGMQVIWGKPDQNEFKGEVLTILMKERPSSVYDVSVPEHPSVR